MALDELDLSGLQQGVEDKDYIVHLEDMLGKAMSRIKELEYENLKLKEEVSFLHEEHDIPSELMNLPNQEYEILQRTIGELNNAKKSLIRTNLIHLSVIKSN